MTKTKLHALDAESWLETVWAALHSHRENGIPEGVDDNDAEWDDITSAMAYIREALGLPDEVSMERIWNVIDKAESFISGFEGDEAQEDLSVLFELREIKKELAGVE